MYVIVHIKKKLADIWFICKIGLKKFDCTFQLSITLPIIEEKK